MSKKWAFFLKIGLTTVRVKICTSARAGVRVGVRVEVRVHEWVYELVRRLVRTGLGFTEIRWSSF